MLCLHNSFVSALLISHCIIVIFSLSTHGTLIGAHQPAPPSIARPSALSWRSSRFRAAHKLHTLLFILCYPHVSYMRCADSTFSQRRSHCSTNRTMYASFPQQSHLCTVSSSSQSTTSRTVPPQCGQTIKSRAPREDTVLSKALRLLQATLPQPQIGMDQTASCSPSLDPGFVAGFTDYCSVSIADSILFVHATVIFHLPYGNSNFLSLNTHHAVYQA